jgi:hypothetical protein
MLWWAIVSALATLFISYITLRIEIFSLLGYWLSFPVEWITGGGKSKKALGIHGTVAILFNSFIYSFAGLISGTLILKDHCPIGYYWFLAGIIVLVIILTLSSLRAIPKANLPFYSITIPNIIGPLFAIVICFFLATKWY